MILEAKDIDGFKFTNIEGTITIKTHDKDTIDVFCPNEDKLIVEEKGGFIVFSYDNEESETVKKTFLQKIFKKTFKLNLPINSSYVEDKDVILIYNLLRTNIDIFVPKSIVESIELDGNIDLVADGISEYLRVYSFGKNSIKFEDIKNVYVDSHGKTECFVNNSLNISLYFSGTQYVKVSSRKTHSLKIKSKGEIQVDSISSIRDLNLDLSGISDINIYGRVEDKKIKRKGIVKVTISN